MWLFSANTHAYNKQKKWVLRNFKNHESVLWLIDALNVAITINLYYFNGSHLGLSRLCSATFEQLLAFGATFWSSSNLEQILPFWATFEQNIGLEHISIKHEKVNDFIEKFNFSIFKIILKLCFLLFVIFFLTDVCNYCEQNEK